MAKTTQPQAAAGERTPRPRTEVDPTTIVKCADPYHSARGSDTHKWDQLFDGVKEGDCFRVTGDEAQLMATARALRVYIKRKGIKGMVVRQQARSKDGIRRVWLLKAPVQTTLRGHWPGAKP